MAVTGKSQNGKSEDQHINDHKCVDVPNDFTVHWFAVHTNFMNLPGMDGMELLKELRKYIIVRDIMGHWLKSAVAKPVVVITDPTWKADSRMAVPKVP